MFDYPLAAGCRVVVSGSSTPARTKWTTACESVFENSCNAHFGTIQGPCTGRFHHPNPLQISPAHLRIGRFADSHRDVHNTLSPSPGSERDWHNSPPVTSAT